MSEVVPERLCPTCWVPESIESGESIWPVGWRCSRCGYESLCIDGTPMFAPDLADTISGFDPKSFEALAKIEDSHFWFVARNELLVGLTQEFFPEANKMLEIGCGNGAVLHALSRIKSWSVMVGSELHPAGLRYARKRLSHDVEFVQMNATRIPADGVFDLVGAFDVIEHIADDEAVLRAMHQALKKGGGAIISVPQHPWLWSSADDDAHHQRRYRVGELDAKLRKCGFEVLFSSSYTTLLLPLMAVSRVMIKREKRTGRFAREFTVQSQINKVLTGILRSEVYLTLAGVRWPIGGSRVIVARAV